MGRHSLPDDHTATGGGAVPRPAIAGGPEVDSEELDEIAGAAAARWRTRPGSGR
ncbi:hypothetical protein [Streptomyces sp. NPDC019224]|uniref:hypothetical protein n=1 Tax=Streptomyces sp. NPDC019224 TaxID=3154484 RepID=UPI003402D4C8